jgi:phosphoserine phosphatase
VAAGSSARDIERGPAGPHSGAFFDFDRTLISGFSAYFAETGRFLSGLSESLYRERAKGIFVRWSSEDVFPEARALVRAHERHEHTED